MLLAAGVCTAGSFREDFDAVLFVVLVAVVVEELLDVDVSIGGRCRPRWPPMRICRLELPANVALWALTALLDAPAGSGLPLACFAWHDSHTIAPPPAGVMARLAN